MFKASTIAHLTDARYFAAKDVEYLGFNLEEGTDGFLEPIYMKAIREWVEGPKLVGEFARSPMSVVREAAIFYGLETVQVPFQTPLTELEKLEGLEIILDYSLDTTGAAPGLEEWQQKAALAHCFLFRSDVETFQAAQFFSEKTYWQTLTSLRPSLLQVNLPAAQWPLVLADYGFAGVSLVGGEEEAVGVKSFEEIEEIFEVLGKGL